MRIDLLDDWLVAEWRKMWRWWSTWMIAIGGVIGSVMSMIPALPLEVQQAIPVEYRVIVVALWSVASLVTRILKQRKVGNAAR